MSLKEIHEMKESTKKTLSFLEYLELTEIPKCVHYYWDNGACEEYCLHDEIQKLHEQTNKDFDSKTECWQCKFRKTRGS